MRVTLRAQRTESLCFAWPHYTWHVQWDLVWPHFLRIKVICLCLEILPDSYSLMIWGNFLSFWCFKIILQLSQFSKEDVSVIHPRIQVNPKRTSRNVIGFILRFLDLRLTWGILSWGWWGVDTPVTNSICLLVIEVTIIIITV